MNRSRKLLDLAHQVRQCTNCNAYVEGCEPAHQNGLASGKGIAVKGQDNRHAAICHSCHSWLDQAGARPDPSGRFQPTREDKREMWTRAHLKTFDLYWEQGWIRVA